MTSGVRRLYRLLLSRHPKVQSQYYVSMHCDQDSSFTLRNVMAKRNRYGLQEKRRFGFFVRMKKLLL